MDRQHTSSFDFRCPDIENRSYMVGGGGGEGGREGGGKGGRDGGGRGVLIID